MVAGDGSVSLCCPKFNVSQKLLHRGQVSASFEEVCGERMPERVGEGAGPKFHDATNRARIHIRTASTNP